MNKETEYKTMGGRRRSECRLDATYAITIHVTRDEHAKIRNHARYDTQFGSMQKWGREILLKAIEKNSEQMGA